MTDNALRALQAILALRQETAIGSPEYEACTIAYFTLKAALLK